MQDWFSATLFAVVGIGFFAVLSQLKAIHAQLAILTQYVAHLVNRDGGGIE